MSTLQRINRAVFGDPDAFADWESLAKAALAAFGAVALAWPVITLALL